MNASPNLPFERLDPITYLPNRNQFIADYEMHPAGADLVMITIADAQHFNAILRALGHEYADDFLRVGAARIRLALPADCEIYHVSILSFAFFPQGDAEAAITSILRDFATPLLCGGIPVVTRIGVGLSTSDHLSASDLLRTALAAAQDSRYSNAGWARYDEKTDTLHRRGFLLLSLLTAALESGNQLSLHFQPKFKLATGRPNGAEALLRWNHPTLGNISPAEFIPLAETTALIDPLTNWVIDHAIAEAAKWERAGLSLTMAVNVSPHNLGRRGFAAEIAEKLRKSSLNPKTFEFEFTEGALVSNDSIVLAQLQELRTLGARIALDDFGTGFSNFNYIAHLPADIIKIDQSFIRRISSDERSAAVVRSLIQLAHRLDYQVVAEGIETAATYRQLAGWRCDEGQGYFMSRPLNADRFNDFIRATPERAITH
jgi:EAL domain-containing protein (putative c-di-GMP-specific phosphodiesterase class I)